MKPTALLSLIALASACSGVTWSAEQVAEKSAERVVVAERTFGEVHFLIGTSKAPKGLEMYVGGNFVTALRDFHADDVIASPDGQHFLAVSNSSKSSLAFAILDRKGRMVASSPHGGDLHYCNLTSWGIGEWVDTSKPQANFSIQKNQMTTPATDYLSVTVRGCDGRTVIVARAPRPGQQVAGATDSMGLSTALNSIVAGSGDHDRGSFFIGDTIANLRGRDPDFGARTLTLTDGRRTSGVSAASAMKALSLPIAWQAAPVFERGSCLPGGAACGGSKAELLIKRQDGSTQVFASGLVGDFIALPASHRIFACSYDVSAATQDNPVMVDLSGNKTSLPAHPGPVRICARTGTGNEVLLVYGLAETGRSYTLARVFDANGVVLAEGTYATRGELAFKVAGESYSAMVPGP